MEASIRITKSFQNKTQIHISGRSTFSDRSLEQKAFIQVTNDNSLWLVITCDHRYVKDDLLANGRHFSDKCSSCAMIKKEICWLIEQKLQPGRRSTFSSYWLVGFREERDFGQGCQAWKWVALPIEPSSTFECLERRRNAHRLVWWPLIRPINKNEHVDLRVDLPSQTNNNENEHRLERGNQRIYHPAYNKLPHPIQTEAAQEP